MLKFKILTLLYFLNLAMISQAMDAPKPNVNLNITNNQIILIPTYFAVKTKDIKDVKFSNDDDNFAVIYENYADIYSIKQQKLLKSIPDDKDNYRKLNAIELYSPIKLIVVALDGAVKTLSFDSNEYLCQFKRPNKATALAFSERLLIVGYVDGSAEIRALISANTLDKWPIIYSTSPELKKSKFRITFDHLNQWTCKDSICYATFDKTANLAVLVTTSGCLKLLKAPENMRRREIKDWTNDFTQNFGTKINLIKFSSDNSIMFILTDNGNYTLDLKDYNLEKTDIADYCCQNNKALIINHNRLFEYDDEGLKGPIIEEQSIINKAFYNNIGNLIVTVLDNGGSKIWYRHNNHKWTCILKCGPKTKIVLSAEGSNFITYSIDSDSVDYNLIKTYELIYRYRQKSNRPNTDLGIESADEYFKNNDYIDLSQNQHFSASSSGNGILPLQTSEQDNASMAQTSKKRNRESSKKTIDKNPKNNNKIARNSKYTEPWAFSDIETYYSGIENIKFNHLGNKFALLGNNCNYVQIWDTEKKQILSETKSHSKALSYLDWHENLDFIITSSNKDIMISDSEGKFQSTYENDYNRITYLKLLPRSMTLIVGHENAIANIYEITPDTIFSPIDIFQDYNYSFGQINYVVFDRSEKMLCLATKNGKLLIYSSNSSTNVEWILKYFVDLKDEIISAKFNNSSSIVFVITKSKAYLINLVDKKKLETSITDYCSLNNRCLKIKGKRIIELQDFNIDNKVNSKLIFTEDILVKKATYNVHGNLIVTTLDNGFTSVWSKYNEQWINVCSVGPDTKVVLSPNNNCFITYSSNSKIFRIWKPLRSNINLLESTNAVVIDEEEEPEFTSE